MPWPTGSPITPEAMGEFDRYCDQHPRDDWCEWWNAERSQEGATTKYQAGDSQVI
jgi:hypothetical protein